MTEVEQETCPLCGSGAIQEHCSNRLCEQGALGHTLAMSRMDSGLRITIHEYERIPATYKWVEVAKRQLPEDPTP